jgi:hypothetical protein
VRWTYAAVLNIIYTKENDADCVHPIRGNVTHRADVTHWVDAIRRDRRKDVNIKLWPDPDISVRKIRIGNISAHVDVYHTNIHAFDMLYPEMEVSRDAIRAFEQQFEYALENYFAPQNGR